MNPTNSRGYAVPCLCIQSPRSRLGLQQNETNFIYSIHHVWLRESKIHHSPAYLTCLASPSSRAPPAVTARDVSHSPLTQIIATIIAIFMKRQRNQVKSKTSQISSASTVSTKKRNQVFFDSKSSEMQSEVCRDIVGWESGRAPAAA